MDITYHKTNAQTYNFVVTYNNDEMLGKVEVTSEVKCALIEFMSELNTSNYEYEFFSHDGPMPLSTSDPNGDKTATRRVDKVEFVYMAKLNSEIVLDFILSLISGNYKFDKIELKHPNKLSKASLDSISTHIKEIIEHLLNQRGKLCPNCMWYYRKELAGFCDFEYKLNINKIKPS